jgi:hypothetical protein
MTDPTGSIMLGLAEPGAIAGLLLILGLLMALSLVFASASCCWA